VSASGRPAGPAGEAGAGAAGLLGLLDYELPAELIAQRPAARREDSRLLVLDRKSGALSDARFAELGRWLLAGDALVVNDTRVRPARLRVRRPSGGRVELLFVRPAAGGDPGWRVLAKPARHASPGARLGTADGALELEVVAAGAHGERVVRVVRGSLEDVLREQGELPLPPYIQRAPNAEDAERYQTVYARVEGAVAAPTAGLHFSDALLAGFAGAGVRRAAVTLHVGPGTFRPVTAADPREHVMEEEWFEVGEDAARTMREARGRGGRVVAVGTTTVRALESMADAHDGEIAPASGWTRKYILPPHRFRAVDALVTNFHLPRTTLLLLVAAFAGEENLRGAYAHAVRERYRFYSYGDAMLVI
jgi:S-adenosylmethionine:tRNA ribosyltransferase-isomerase